MSERSERKGEACLTPLLARQQAGKEHVCLFEAPGKSWRKVPPPKPRSHSHGLMTELSSRADTRGAAFLAGTVPGSSKGPEPR